MQGFCPTAAQKAAYLQQLMSEMEQKQHNSGVDVQGQEQC
jgi:hypothetical protein